MSDYWQQPLGAGSDDDDDDDDSGDTAGESGAIGFSGRDGIIYMLDAAIAAKDDHLTTALEIIELSLLNRILRSDKDMIGIIVYNTQHSPAPPSTPAGDGGGGHQVVPPHTAIMWPVQVISKSAITYVKNMRASDDLHAFATHYGTAVAPPNFAEALWLCSRLLTGCDYKLQSASIVLFTNEERPLGDDAAEEQKVFVRALDLRAMNVDLMVVPLVDEFNVEPFYRELICTVHDLDVDTFRVPAPAEQRENLCMRLYQRNYRRACLRYFSVQLGDGVQMGCGTYALTRKATLPSKVHLVAATNEVVVARRCYVRAELDANGDAVGERVLLPGELTKYQQVGGQRVQFSVEELSAMRSIMAPGMKLLGFKPLSALPKRSFIKPSRLLYPSERNVKGSTRLFRALWSRCLTREKFALCVFTQIRKVAPRYVALVPQTEATDGCDGFRIVYLPMQTDIRELDIFKPALPSVPDGGQDLMAAIIKKLKFRYEPRIFEDPQLQQFYATLEALVYDEPVAQLEDTTLPDTERQDERLGDLVDRVTALFGEDCAVAPKRAAGRAADGEANAKVGRVDAAPVLSREDVSTAIMSGAVEKLTVGALRDFLLANGHEKSVQKLRKPELIALTRKQCEL